MTEPNTSIPSPLLLYDGQCALCNTAVRFLLRADKDERLLFAPLDSETGRQIRAMEIYPPSAPDSVVLYDNGRIYWYSDALIAILAYLPRSYRWGQVARYIPRFLRDAIYRAVARMRKSFFVSTSSCPTMPPSYRRRFLPSPPKTP
jgi:predicted DCC family thiol-disulfide oxidoreductase YuxK